MPWLTWPYTQRKIGEYGCLSGPVVVRTVVSVQFAATAATTGYMAMSASVLAWPEGLDGSADENPHITVTEGWPWIVRHQCQGQQLLLLGGS